MNYINEKIQIQIQINSKVKLVLTLDIEIIWFITPVKIKQTIYYIYW